MCSQCLTGVFYIESAVEFFLLSLWGKKYAASALLIRELFAVSYMIDSFSQTKWGKFNLCSLISYQF